MISNTASSLATAASRQLTPFERDTQAYGKAGAAIMGGARALAEAASATCTFSSEALEQAAAAVDTVSTACGAAADAAEAVVDAVADGVEGLVDDVAGCALVMLAV